MKTGNKVTMTLVGLLLMYCVQFDSVGWNCRKYKQTHIKQLISLEGLFSKYVYKDIDWIYW